MFVGRTSESARLRRLADDGRGGLALVVGQAGIGKSALIDDFVASQRRLGRRVLWGRATPASARFGWLEQLSRAGSVGRLDPDPALVPSDQERELTALLAAALGELAPVVLVLEDAHWADVSSKRIIAGVVDELVGADAVIVVTSRSRAELGELDERGGLTEVISLAPFDDDEISAVSESALGRPATSDELATLRAQTGGIPLLVVEMLAGAGPRSISVSGVLDATLSRLTDDVRATISLLAIAGPGTPKGVLAAAASQAESTIDDHLRSAASVGVLDDGGTWFRHELLAEAARDRLGDTERQVAHIGVARAWERRDQLGDKVAAHLLAAFPATDPGEAAVAACDAASRLRAAGRSGDACDLLATALEVVSTEVTPAVSTRLLLELGESHWDLGDTQAALAAFDRALHASGDADDVTLAARAAVAAQRRHDPFFPDPGSRARLAELDEALGADDSPLRVELLGRRSVLSTQPPPDLRRAEQLALESLAMARRLGDPGLIVTALRDRFLCCRSPEELDARTAAAEEVLALGGRSGSVDWLLVGYEWRIGGCLGTGDLAGASRSITELTSLAQVMQSPYWRLSALLRRAGLAALLGDRDAALDLTDEVSTLVESVGAAHEVIGAQLGLRTSIAMLYGVVDDGLPELLSAGREMFDAAPVSFVQIAQAAGSVLVGDIDDARHRAIPWLDDPATARHGPSPLSTLSLMAECVVELELVDYAPKVFEHLEPFRGRTGIDLGTHVDLPVDHRLAGLALLVGDHRRAIDHALAAVDLARRMGAPPVEARSLALLAEAHQASGDIRAAVVARDRAEALADPIGLVLPDARVAHAPTAPTDKPAERRVELTRTRDGAWRVRDGGVGFELASSRGMRQLARLVVAPGAEVGALELAGHHDADALGVDADLGPALDARARREYRRHILELHADIDDADEAHDLERAARARVELDAVLDELTRSTGLGGRDRPQRSTSERARVNVTRSLRRAIAAIARHDPELGAHLQSAVRTGSFCSYDPDPSSSIVIEVTG